MTLQEQKNCPMISSKATVASRNSLNGSCKPLIRLRKILASRSLKGEGNPRARFEKLRRLLALRLVDGPPHAFRRGRHVDVADAVVRQRIDDGVHDRYQRAGAAGLAASL